MDKRNLLEGARLMDDEQKQERMIKEITAFLNENKVSLSDVKVIFCHILHNIENKNIISL